MILQALIQGGWSPAKDEEEEKDKSSDNDNNAESSEHQLVNSILKGSEEGQMVQSALKVSKFFVNTNKLFPANQKGDDKAIKVQKLVEELDQDLDLDGEEEKKESKAGPT